MGPPMFGAGAHRRSGPTDEAEPFAEAGRFAGGELQSFSQNGPCDELIAMMLSSPHPGALTIKVSTQINSVVRKRVFIRPGA